MKTRAQIALLPDDRRLHLQDGPIDLIVEGFGLPFEVRRAYSAAAERFTTILDELCSELPLLRQPAGPTSRVRGAIAKRMLEAVLPVFSIGGSIHHLFTIFVDEEPANLKE